MKFAIVASRFNEEITENLLKHALQAFAKGGVAAKSVRVVRVPGAYEIPLVAKRLAKTKQFAAVVCLGAVIQGQTKHNEHIAHAVFQGLTQVSLETGVPVILGVITPLNWRQAVARSNGGPLDRGREAAETALEIAGIMRKL